MRSSTAAIPKAHRCKNERMYVWRITLSVLDNLRSLLYRRTETPSHIREACKSETDSGRHLYVQPLGILFVDDEHSSLAQCIHPAFDACTELLRYSNRCTFQFILGFIDLTLDVSFLLEQFFEFFEMRTSRCLPVEICQHMAHDSVASEGAYRISLWAFSSPSACR